MTSRRNLLALTLLLVTLGAFNSGLQRAWAEKASGGGQRLARLLAPARRGEMAAVKLAQSALASDTCVGAQALTVNTPVNDTTLGATNDYQLASGSPCFTANGASGNTPDVFAGPDVVYTFTAPATGTYSIRVQPTNTSQAYDVALYTSSTCPGGVGVQTVSCATAADRRGDNGGDEIKCQPLMAGQLIYIFVDGFRTTGATGGSYEIEVVNCVNETESNDTPATANALASGQEGSLIPITDVDFYSLGTPATDSRVFAILDGGPSLADDYDLRVTTETNTLEYDDLNNVFPFGANSPNVAGTPTTGVATYLRVNYFSQTTPAAGVEPYRIVSVIQPPIASATTETEPNDTTATASSAANNYFSGVLTGTTDSVDVYAFPATAGDLVYLGLDGDPLRNNTPINGQMALLDSVGTVLVSVNDSGSTSSVTAGATLTSTTPFSPGEGLLYRIRTTGTYYARVMGTTTAVSGDYLLSISKNGQIGGGVSACPSTLTVNDLGDTGDNNPGDGMCETASGNGICTLRAAIQESNALTSCSPLTINFNIPGSGTRTITPATPLPDITDTVTIDGLTQPGVASNACTAGPLLIEIAVPTGTNGHGLRLNGAGSSGSLIRGLAISGFNNNFFSSGITIFGGSSNNAIQCNFVGTNAAGTAQANGGNSMGIRVNTSSNNVVGTNADGSNDANERNLASGNGIGIYFDTSTGNRAAGNYVGTDITGANPIPNGNGIVAGFTATNNIIGYDGSGSVATEANRVRFNAQAGVSVFASDSTGNRISGNHIDSNAQLGIDLSNGAGPDNLTVANDTGDVDTGANNFQNFPVITSAVSNGVNTTVNFTLDSNPGNYTIEFFSNPTCDVSGNGEGQVYLGSMSVTLPGGPFNITTLPATMLGHVITATAIKESGTGGVVGDTSEFSACLTVVAANTPPTITSNNVPVPAGSSATPFTIAMAVDPNQSVNTLGITINGNPTTASSNGVTVSNVAIQSNGSVTANIATTCAATTATFNLVVTDNQNATGTGTLTVTVTMNTSPTLSYNPQIVTAGTTPTIPTATGPSDNGTFTIGSVSVSPNNGGLGVSLNQSNGVVTVTSALLIGTYTVTVPITDNCGATNNAQLTIQVTCPTTITVNPPTLPNATVNTAYPPTITASPAGGNYTFSVTSGALPPGLTLNSNGSFSGAPTQNGTFNFRITAMGFVSCSGFNDYTLLVNCPTITVNPASLPGGTIGTAYSQSVSASPAGIYLYSVTSGALPTGLLLNNATGALTGTPTASGSFTFTITAAAGTCIGSNTYTVTIACPAITLAPATLPNGVQGTAYNQSVSAAPAGTTYSYAVTTNVLPPGLSLNSATGAITGTPTANGSYAFAITATGWGGCTKSQSYNLLITGTCATITVNPTTLPGATIGAAYSQTVSAMGGTAPYTFAVTQGALPPGLTLDANTGALTGTATSGGSFSFRITATGVGGCTGSRTYVVTVSCATLTFTPPMLPNGTRGLAYSQQLAVSPASNATFSILLGSLPPGFALNSAGLLSGVTNQTGTFNFTVKALVGSCQGTKAYSLVINAGNAALAMSGDYDGDGQSDPTLWSASDGVWRILKSSNQQAVNQSWGRAGDVTLLGDYDGDGKSDLAVFRPSDATFYVKRSSDGGYLVKQWGLATDVPVPGDYDGDGKTDLAVWRGSTGTWYIVRSSDGQYEVASWGSVAAPFSDVPVAGDYDGDGKSDVAVFRRGTGTWLVKRSSDGQYLSKQWGLGTDVPVAADYDGDGQTDIAVWRGNSWYIWQSATDSYRTAEWGASQAPYFDQAVPGDYDGDGKADLVVWRAAQASWYLSLSAAENRNASSVVSLGQASDRAVNVRRP